ncbi:MAG: hypothetical protein M1481_05665 [Candidatus Thermoplasmatota archaeon]|jgi:hypothetical protein|nr:hypothetical protein [Candidatus Thermoplasmatota archaeon]MCL5963310.1 hypothetical protein [Candidatus Thermoplasmatota archaeon]
MYGRHHPRYRFIKKHGQTALIDSVIFFMLMLIASVILVTFTSFFLRVSPSVNFYYQQQYTNRFLSSVLQSTVNSTHYINGGTQIYINGTFTIQYMIGEYLNLSMMGISPSGLANISGIIHRYFNLGLVPPYHYAMYAYYPSATSPKASLFFTDSATHITSYTQLPNTKTASFDLVYVNGGEGYIWLYVWPTTV